MDDRRIRNAYSRITLDEAAAARIWNALERETSPGKENKTMKSIKKRPLRVALICALLAVLMVGTAYAASGVMRYVGTYRMPEDQRSTRFEDLDRFERIAGYPVAAVEAFSNGYRFASMQLGGQAVFDENYKAAKEFYGVNFTYKKDGAPDLILAVSPVLETAGGTSTYVPTDRLWIERIPVDYSLDHYKVVPPDYRESAEDLAAKESGHYYISYGSDEIEEYDCSFATFTLDGADYVLMFQVPVEAQEMYAMAGEIIAAAKG